MADINLKKWYVVRAVSGQENKVKAYIETEINRLGMSDYISQVLVPTEKVVQVRDGKKIAKDKVYFPGYVMIEANLVGEIPHIIKSYHSMSVPTDEAPMMYAKLCFFSDMIEKVVSF